MSVPLVLLQHQHAVPRPPAVLLRVHWTPLFHHQKTPLRILTLTPHPPSQKTLTPHPPSQLELLHAQPPPSASQTLLEQQQTQLEETEQQQQLAEAQPPRGRHRLR